MLFDISFVADWHKIGEHRQSLTDRSNQRKNNWCIDYNYKVGDKVLIDKECILCKSESKYSKEPWTITTVYTNGTIRTQCKTKLERLNTWRTDKIVLINKIIYVRMVNSIPFLLLLSQNLTLLKVILSLHLAWPPGWWRYFFPLLRFFSTWFSPPIASFAGASVIGHGIMVVGIAH